MLLSCCSTLDDELFLHDSLSPALLLLYAVMDPPELPIFISLLALEVVVMHDTADEVGITAIDGTGDDMLPWLSLIIMFSLST